MHGYPRAVPTPPTPGPWAPSAEAPDAVGPLPGYVSIVTPCLDEELTVGEFVDWCHEGLERAGVEGEVVIVDSSTDRSAEIAEEHGARVLRVPKRGLGRAYIDAEPELRGEWIIMGDCDLTYDFREIGPFVEQLAEGAEFVMGSRLRGYIEPGAMPKLHQFFGTPLTTWILNRMYGAGFSDIHCGMRAMTADALRRIDLQSQSWEYASEMVIKAAKLRLRTAEVPVRFYRDRDGRESHHKRLGWWSPWAAGWRNLSVMLVYAPDFFLVVPGLITLLFGLLLSGLLVAGPVMIGDLGLDLHFMLLGLALSMLGYSALQLGVLARVHYNFDERFTERVMSAVTIGRGALAAAALMLAGVALDAILLADWISNGFRLTGLSYPGVLGLLLIVLGFQTFTFAILLQMLGRRGASRRP
jgi:glycosyltransferase involved in cell wall biosynthesis